MSVNEICCSEANRGGGSQNQQRIRGIGICADDRQIKDLASRSCVIGREQCGSLIVELRKPRQMSGLFLAGGIYFTQKIPVPNSFLTDLAD